MIISAEHNFNCSSQQLNLTLTLSLAIVSRHGISNSQQPDRLWNSLFRLTVKKRSKLRISVPSWGIHWWPVDSPRKELVIWKAFSCHDVNMKSIQWSVFVETSGTYVQGSLYHEWPLSSERAHSPTRFNGYLLGYNYNPEALFVQLINLLLQ